MEAAAALVGTDRGIELHAVAHIHVILALMILPGDTEDHRTLGYHETLDEIITLILLIRHDVRP